MAYSALKDLFQRGYLAKGAVANQNSVVFVSSACSGRYTTMYWYLLPQYMYVYIYIFTHPIACICWFGCDGFYMSQLFWVLWVL